jgi:hypothetical protein
MKIEILYHSGLILFKSFFGSEGRVSPIFY